MTNYLSVFLAFSTVSRVDLLFKILIYDWFISSSDEECWLDTTNDYPNSIVPTRCRITSNMWTRKSLLVTGGRRLGAAGESSGSHSMERPDHS